MMKKLPMFLIVVYLIIWLASLVVFWCFIDGADAMGYGIIFLWILLPLTTFIISLLIGYSDNIKWKLLSIIIFSIMYMLAEYSTFNAANMITNGKINMPNFEMILIGVVISMVGVGIGTFIKNKRK